MHFSVAVLVAAALAFPGARANPSHVADVDADAPPLPSAVALHWNRLQANNDAGAWSDAPPVDQAGKRWKVLGRVAAPPGLLRGGRGTGNSPVLGDRGSLDSGVTIEQEDEDAVSFIPSKAGLSSGDISPEDWTSRDQSADPVPLPRRETPPQPPPAQTLPPEVMTRLNSLGTEVNKIDPTMKAVESIDHGADMEGKATAFADSLTQVKETIKFIQGCFEGGCEPEQVADQVFSIVSTLGGVIACFNPAAGAIIQSIGALGSFVASFFGSPGVAKAMPGLDEASVEAAAFRAVMSVQDTNTRAEFADFNAVLTAATTFNGNILKVIENADSSVRDGIIEDWFQQYHEFKWDDMMARVKETGRAYMAAYGDIKGSRRSKFVEWAKSSAKTCKLENYLIKNNGGRDNLNKCKKNMQAAKTNYEYVKAFAGEYESLAIKMTAYWTGAVAILTKHSTCEDNPGNPSCHYYVRIRALNYEVTEVMMTKKDTLLNTISNITQTCEDPTPNQDRWPFNQVCGTWPGKCTYEYLVFTTEADQIATVGGCQGGGCKMLINEISNYDLVSFGHNEGGVKAVAEEACEEVLGNSPEHRFYGGIIGWKSDQHNTPENQGCKGAVEHVYQFNHDISMFAIPAYTLDIPECVDLLEDSENFGLEATKEESKYQWVTRASSHEAYHGAIYSKPNRCRDDPWANGTPSDDEMLAWCHYCPSFYSTANGKSWDAVCCEVTADAASNSLRHGVPTLDPPKPQKDKWCDSCPTQYSLVGNTGWDYACWEEKIKTCNIETAMTTIYGNAVKAASQEGWTSGWKSTSGGYWKDVKDKKCTERDFNEGEKVKCFYEEYLNQGCLYD